MGATGTVNVGSGSANINIGTNASGTVNVGVSGSTIALKGTTNTTGILNVNALMTILCGSNSFSLGKPGDNALWISANNYINGVYLTASSGTGWTNVSDRTLKKDIEPLTNMLDKVNELNAVKFKYIGNDKEVCMGFIAQELQNQFPELVSETSSGKLGIAYTGLIPAIVKSIQEQQEQINILKDEIDVLKNK